MLPKFLKDKLIPLLLDSAAAIVNCDVYFCNFTALGTAYLLKGARNSVYKYYLSNGSNQGVN